MDIPTLISHTGGSKRIWVAGYSDFNASTWQCSHVRLCRVDGDAPDYSREEALAWILLRNDTNYLLDWKARLAELSISPATVENLRASIRTVTDEVAKSENLPSPSPFPIDEASILDDTTVFRLEGLKLYPLGPTQVYCWEGASSLFYLEVHYES